VKIANGLRTGEFYVLHQPFFASDGTSTAGVEALLLWNHLSRTRIGPDEFIIAAEQSGIIFELGQFVLRQACRCPWTRSASKLRAEGIEKEEQRRFLRACGCHYLQGHLFSKPVAAAIIGEKLAA
jgi:EAL domain-containing protein (putative c-di-GMP-specific phosphodiesterase class I)